MSRLTRQAPYPPDSPVSPSRRQAESGPAPANRGAARRESAMGGRRSADRPSEGRTVVPSASARAALRERRSPAPRRRQSGERRTGGPPGRGRRPSPAAQTGSDRAEDDGRSSHGRESG